MHCDAAAICARVAASGLGAGGVGLNGVADAVGVCPDENVTRAARHSTKSVSVFIVAPGILVFRSPEGPSR